MSKSSTGLRFHEFGGVDVLGIDSVPVRDVRPDEVRFDVLAFALNRADLMFIRGEHYTMPEFPSLIGSEAVGIVTATGSAVREFSIGDRVTSIPFFSLEHGVHGETAVLPARFLTHVPSELSDIEACSIWMEYLTSYFALVEVAGVGSADAVLVRAGASSAGLGALQMASMLGARTIATTRSRHKAAALVAHGANAVSVDEDRDLGRQIANVTKGKGVRVAFDPLGGASLSEYVDSLAPDAVVFGYGTLSGEQPIVPVAAMARKSALFHPYSMFNHVSKSDQLARGLRTILLGLESGELRPVIDRVFDYVDAIDAYRYMESNRQVGKIVVRVP